MQDAFNLLRFVEAQELVYADVRCELSEGKKRSHWMWFIFPQVAGLGSSSTARNFSIASREEAEAYLQHELLGTRLLECTRLVLNIEDRTIDEIFGTPDNLKFCSSMTLFANVADNRQMFDDALAKFCRGEPDRKTLDILAEWSHEETRSRQDDKIDGMR